MAINVLSGQMLNTANNAVLNSATVASMSCFVRINTVHSTTGTTILVGKEFQSPFALFRGAGGTSGVTMLYGTNASTATFIAILTVGVVYHLAWTYNAGTANFYVNGVLAHTTTQGTALGTVSGQYTEIGSTTTNTIDLEIDNIGIWNGYAFTSADVIGLRNRTTAISAINGGSGLTWTVSCAGTPGAPVALADPGITSPVNGSITVLTGAPQYTANLTYTPPARVRSGWPQIGPSGQTLIFTFEDTNGNLTTVPGAPATAPTYVDNGGSPVTPVTPLYKTTLPWVVYPLASAVAAGDTVTWSGVDAWILTAAGPVGAVTNGTVVNATGGSILTGTAADTALAPTARVKMRQGFNLQSDVYFRPVMFYANLMKGAGAWGSATAYDSNFYPTAGTNPGCALRNPNTAPNGFAGFPGSGTWTLLWDGPGVASLAASGNSTVTLISATTGQPTGNVATYTVTRTTAPPYSAGVGVSLNLTNGTCTNMRVYPPGVATDGSQKFHPQLVRMLQNCGCIRFMDFLTTNASSVVDATYLMSASRYSYTVTNAAPYTPAMSITQVGPDANSDGYFTTTNRTPILFTTSAAHGLVDGQVVTFSGMSGTIGCHSGASTTNFQINAFALAVRVRSATTFAVGPFVAINTGSGPYVVTTTQSLTGSCCLSNYLFRPVQDMVDLCNLCNADLYINIPAAATNAFVTSVFNTIGAGLRPGLRAWLEYANEVWNLSTAFAQADYIFGQSVIGGFANGSAFYAHRAAQIHTVAAAALATFGRATDLVRVFGSQFSNPTVTTNVINQCVADGSQVDVVCVATYMNGGLDATWNVATTVGDGFTPAMLHDITNLYWLDDQTFAPTLASHNAILKAAYPNAQLIGYEGGPQSGTALASTSAGGGAQSRAWGRHPRMLENYTALIRTMQAAGFYAYIHYTAAMEMATFTYANDANWPAYLRWNQTAGTGDGTDGQFDNRTNYEDMDDVVSVTGLALNRMISAYDRGDLTTTVRGVIS